MSGPEEVVEPATAVPPNIGRFHARRLRDVYRSAGWPSQDLVEVELLTAGLLQQVHDEAGRLSMRVTPAGLVWMTQVLARNRAALSAHEALEEQVARNMQRAGRIVWRGLSLRARVTGCDPDPDRWCIAKPDVFSVRNTSVEDYLAPVVHEIKVRRADLLSDLRKPAKRAAYLDLSSECWYVLGRDARGRPIGEADEIPATCGVMVAEGDPASPRLEVVRPAPRRAMTLPFGVWLALAKATPLRVLGDDDQAML
ncbi:hypothetical protein GN316_09020 [Xylophilus sp. Kf1]|nr:hypothetical protein [Xylophilus sp. Kf1]